MTSDPHRPPSWLRQLARLQPAPWRWGPALRAAVCIAGPMALGFATNQLPMALLIAMGAVLAAGGEGAGTYRSRFRQMAIATPIGACGYLVGYLGALPYPVVIAAMAAIAFAAAIVSSYGAAFSIGSMQFLILASLAIGLPDIAPFWQPALLFVAGAAFYAFALWIETLFDRKRPEQRMLADLIAALAGLAAVRAADPDGAASEGRREAARRKVTDASRALYAALIETRRSGRTHETVVHAEILDAADALFAGMIAERDPETLRATSTWLDALSGTVLRRAAAPPPPADALSPSLARLAAAVATGAFIVRVDGAATPEARRRWSLRFLAVGPVTLQRATALALCIAAAYATRYVIHGGHWYWAPLTVALVMKPDLGSVFVRAVLRAVGTSLGVVVGATLMFLLPKGYLLVASIAMLALAIPWAKSVSYGVQALVVTPLVLVLLDLIAQVPQTVDYGAERLVDTVVGAAIALVLGYFIWPRRQGRTLAVEFGAAMDAIADYLVAVCAPVAAGAANDLAPAARWTAYARLSDLRAILGRAMSEPPPAGREAAAWFPVVAAAERICDRITARAATPEAPPPAEAVAAVAQRLRSLASTAPPAAAPTAGDDFLSVVSDEAGRIAARLALLGAGGPDATTEVARPNQVLPNRSETMRSL